MANSISFRIYPPGGQFGIFSGTKNIWGVIGAWNLNPLCLFKGRATNIMEIMNIKQFQMLKFTIIFCHLLPTRMQITIHWLHICKCQNWRRMSDFSDRSRRDQFISAENLISAINKHPLPSSTAFSSEKNCKSTLFLISVKLARLIDSDVKLIRVCWGYWSIINQTELLWSIINQTSYCFAFRHIAQAQWGADYGRWFPW